jgi:hypothetical protein
MLLITRLRKSRRESGAAAVEAAIITPLFLMLIWAIVEFGPAFLVWSSVKAASKDGAREASSSGQDAFADYNVLDTIRRTSRVQNLQYVIVFKGNPCPAGSTTNCGVHSKIDPTCVIAAESASGPAPHGLLGKCNIYLPADLARPNTDFGWSPSETNGIDRYYPAIDRKDYTTGPPDYVGVYVKSLYASPTGLVGNRKITESTVQQVEARRAVG